MLTVALSGSVNASIGDDLLLPSFAAPIIGGVALAGGVVSVLGTCLAAFVVRLVDVARAQFGINQQWVDLIVGAVVLGVVLIGAIRGKISEACSHDAVGGKPDQDLPRGTGAGRCHPPPDAGSVHALLGENGAGKSTLVKVLTGVYRPDGGRITLDGEPVQFGGPLDALRAGIGVVHQERNLVPAFTRRREHHAAPPARADSGWSGAARSAREARRCLDLLDLDLDPDAPVASLSVAQAQLVEIAKALSVDNRVLLLDEPTASLTGDEADRLYAIVRKLTGSGHAVVLVSHKLEEVFAVADTVTVLRDGRSVAQAAATRRVQPGSGRRPDGRAGARHRGTGRPYRRPRAPRRHWSCATSCTARGHRGVSLSLAPGEILGLYGLVGAGRTELAKALLGLDRITGGQVLLHGEPVHIRSVGEALRRYRVGYVTENRKEEGLFLEQPITRNIGGDRVAPAHPRRPDPGQGRAARWWPSTPRASASGRPPRASWRVSSPAATSRRSASPSGSRRPATSSSSTSRRWASTCVRRRRSTS